MDVNREELRRDLDVLYEWAEKWQLRFNVGKCKVMYCGGPSISKTEYKMKQPNNNTAILQETVVEKDVYLENQRFKTT